MLSVNTTNGVDKQCIMVAFSTPEECSHKGIAKNARNVTYKQHRRGISKPTKKLSITKSNTNAMSEISTQY